MTTILRLKGMTNRVGKRWLLIAEPAREVMSMALCRGPPSMNWAIAPNGGS